MSTSSLSESLLFRNLTKGTLSSRPNYSEVAKLVSRATTARVLPVVMKYLNLKSLANFDTAGHYAALANMSKVERADAIAYLRQFRAAAIDREQVLGEFLAASMDGAPHEKVGSYIGAVCRVAIAVNATYGNSISEARLRDHVFGFLTRFAGVSLTLRQKQAIAAKISKGRVAVSESEKAARRPRDADLEARGQYYSLARLSHASDSKKQMKAYVPNELSAREFKVSKQLAQAHLAERIGQAAFSSDPNIIKAAELIAEHELAHRDGQPLRAYGKKQKGLPRSYKTFTPQDYLYDKRAGLSVFATKGRKTVAHKATELTWSTLKDHQKELVEEAAAMSSGGADVHLLSLSNWRVIGAKHIGTKENKRMNSLAAVNAKFGTNFTGDFGKLQQIAKQIVSVDNHALKMLRNFQEHGQGLPAEHLPVSHFGGLGSRAPSRRGSRASSAVSTPMIFGEEGTMGSEANVELYY